MTLLARLETAGELADCDVYLGEGAARLQSRVAGILRDAAPEKSLDLSALSHDEICDTVLRHSREPKLLVFLFAEKGVAVMAQATLSKVLPDLWSPSADDLCIVPATAGRILVLDHEESFAEYRVESQSDSIRKGILALTGD